MKIGRRQGRFGLKAASGLQAGTLPSTTKGERQAPPGPARTGTQSPCYAGRRGTSPTSCPARNRTGAASASNPARHSDRKTVGWGKSGEVRVITGGRRCIKKKRRNI